MGGDLSKHSPFRAYRSGLEDAQNENFDPDLLWSTIEFREVPFDLRRVQLALFESTYRSPITLLFPKEHADIKLTTDIKMTVELAHAMYEIGDPESTPAGCYDTPSWYLRGVAHFTGPTSEPETAPAHVFLSMDEGRVIHAAQVQVVIDPDRLRVHASAPNGA